MNKTRARKLKRDEFLRHKRPQEDRVVKVKKKQKTKNQSHTWEITE